MGSASRAAGRSVVRGVLRGARQRRVRGVREEAVSGRAAVVGGAVPREAVYCDKQRDELSAGLSTEGRREFGVSLRIHLQLADEVVVFGAVSRCHTASVVGIVERAERKLPYRA